MVVMVLEMKMATKLELSTTRPTAALSATMVKTPGLVTTRVMTEMTIATVEI